MSLIELSRFIFIVFVSLSTIFAQETLGPWRKGDFAYSTQVADDRPNEGSHLLVETYYRRSDFASPPGTKNMPAFC